MIPAMIDTKPTKQMTGATLMRIVLNISGAYFVGSEDAPLMSTNPITTITMLIASMMKFTFPNARFFFSMSFMILLSSTSATYPVC